MLLVQSSKCILLRMCVLIDGTKMFSCTRKDKRLSSMSRLGKRKGTAGNFSGEQLTPRVHDDQQETGNKA